MPARVRDVRMRGFRERATVADATAILERRIGALGGEVVTLSAASGRLVLEDVVARVSVPHFARAAMDGYALAAAATARATAASPTLLRIAGDALPGRPFAGALGAGHALRITTGAPLPEGADAVLMAEHAEEIERDGGASLVVRAPVAARKHVGAIGEDVAAGVVVVRAGRRLRPQDLGVLASVGAGRVLVVRRPAVRIVITGDELLPPGEAPSGACIADANGPMLEALAWRDGAASVEVVRVRDDRERVREAMISGSPDVVLISGGSSVGPEDHAPLVLAEAGELTVHGVALRPAGPAGFGFLGARPVFLLPGNPVSCLCAYELFAGPSVRALGGLPRGLPHARRRCRAAEKLPSELGRTDYMRVRVEGDRVFPIMTSGASILSSTTRADGFVILGDDCEGLAEGTEVDVRLYDVPDR